VNCRESLFVAAWVMLTALVEAVGGDLWQYPLAVLARARAATCLGQGQGPPTA